MHLIPILFLSVRRLKEQRSQFLKKEILNSSPSKNVFFTSEPKYSKRWYVRQHSSQGGYYKSKRRNPEKSVLFLNCFEYGSSV